MASLSPTSSAGSLNHRPSAVFRTGISNSIFSDEQIVYKGSNFGIIPVNCPNFKPYCGIVKNSLVFPTRDANQIRTTFETPYDEANTSTTSQQNVAHAE